jgi:hypothetical protein
MTKQAKEEIDFWLGNIHKLNGRPILSTAAMEEWQVDASETAIGACKPNSKQQESFAEPLPTALIGTSSTLRELHAVLRAVKRWGESSRDRTIRLCMDSFPAARNIARGGGPVLELSRMSKTIWQEAQKFGITLTPVWIERERNKEADRLSKTWERLHKLQPQAERWLLNRIEQTNRESKSDFRLVNVEFNQIRNAIQQAKAERAQICIVHPMWPSQSWFLQLDEHKTAQHVIGLAQHALKQVESDTKSSQQPAWQIYATFLDFSA